jgi:uncharacterized protein (DUF849 family)
MGIMYADGVRIGLEDNLYYKDKELATNYQLLHRLLRIMEELDVVPMSPEEFKTLGYVNKINSSWKE